MEGGILCGYVSDCTMHHISVGIFGGYADYGILMKDCTGCRAYDIVTTGITDVAAIIRGGENDFIDHLVEYEPNLPPNGYSLPLCFKSGGDDLDYGGPRSQHPASPPVYTPAINSQFMNSICAYFGSGLNNLEFVSVSTQDPPYSLGQFSHNLYYGQSTLAPFTWWTASGPRSYATFSAWQAESGVSQSELYGNPSFQSMSLGVPGLRLLTGSPACQSGISDSIAGVDFAGNPYGSAPSIGVLQPCQASGVVILN